MNHLTAQATITAPSLHHHCTITAPSLHHHCTGDRVVRELPLRLGLMPHYGVALSSHIITIVIVMMLLYVLLL